MKNEKKLAVMDFLAKHKITALAIAAGVLVPSALVFAQSQGISPSVASTIVNCAVAGSCNIGVAATEVSEAVEKTFGANAYEVTRWISGEFTDDLAVLDDVTVTDDLTVGGDLITAYASTTSLVREAYASYTSVASSQTLCSIQNTGSVNRVLDFVSLVYATNTATGGGAQQFTISLSATQGATGTGSSLLLDSALAVPTNGIQNITTTSTIMGATTDAILWTKNTWLNFLIASPTTTFTGDCRASYL